MALQSRSTARKVSVGFDPQAYLQATDPASKVVRYRSGQVVFAQGDPAAVIKYIQSGAVRLSVLSHTGKEAVVATLGPGLHD